MNSDCIINILKFLPFKNKVHTSIICKSWYELNKYLFDVIEVDLYLYFNNCYYRKWFDNIKGKEYTLQANYNVNSFILFLERFHSCDKVTSIHLICNFLKNLPDIIYKCENIIELDIGNNNFYNSDLNDLIKFKHLSVLDLHSTNLNNLPNSICNLPLKYLYLSFNELTDLPIDFENLQTLIILKLDSNCFSNIPNSIYKLFNLKILDFNNNDISVIDPSVSNLKKLEKISLCANNIRRLPEEIFNLYELTYFNFGYNLIKKLPSKIINLTKLIYVNFAHNHIQNVPKVFYRLKNVTHLCLASNNIINISKKIGRFDKLLYLNLNDNRIHNLPSEINKLINLKYLDLQNNYLHSIPNISKLTSLEYIMFHHNLINFLDIDEFVNFDKLKQLVIDVNVNINIPRQINKVEFQIIKL